MEGMTMPKSETTMKTIENEKELENMDIHIRQLQALITDLRIMKLTTENFDLLKEYPEMFIYKSSEMFNNFYEKFSDIEQVLDDTAFYLQNLAGKME